MQSSHRKKTQRANSELSFKSQEEVDNYNKLRLGYKSPMEGFGEDFFVSLLKSQYHLELELERMKAQLVVDCLDFNAIIGFRLFNPPRDRTLNLGIENVMQGFGALGVPLTVDQARLIIKRYDNDRDGYLTFTNIRDIFKPRDPHLSNEFKRRLPFDHKK